MSKQQQELQPIIMEHEQEGKDVSSNTYYDDEKSHSSCFSLFCCFDSRHPGGETAGFLYQSTGGSDLINKDNWFMKRAKSVKEYSELVAGPKWKNFIRRFSRRNKMRSSAPFQYDPQSYALNFNDGVGGDAHEDDDLLPRSFSTRFAPPSRSNTQL